ncbi:hypothetical protein D3C83_255130 [compost metagenome]
MPEPLDRRDEIVALADERIAPLADFGCLGVGAQVDRAETLALLLVAFQPRFGLVEVG